MYDFLRNIAKRVNFGIIYGAGPGAIQRQVSTPERPVSEEQCSEYIQKYFHKYRGVQNWINLSHGFLKRHEYVQNAFGRYRRFPGLKQLQYWEQDRAARQAVNFLIQGSAADLFKTAATRVWDILDGKKTRLVNFVHDELQFYWHKSELGLLKDVKEAMEDFEFDVPIIAEVSYASRDWSQKKELKQ
jgi:DNA polymerase-1